MDRGVRDVSWSGAGFAALGAERERAASGADFEFVAHAIERADIIAATCLTELTLEIFHMGIDEIQVIIAHGMFPGKMFGDRILGDNPVLIGRQIKQQIVFLPGQVYEFIADNHGLAHQVDG